MVGVAVIGAGNWGKNLARNFANLPDVNLKYICDLNEKVRASMEAQYPSADVTDDVSRVLSDVDVEAVVVAVDAPLHYKIGKAALEASKHTYVEKPLALTPEHAEELITLAEARSKKLMVGHLLEYHPAVEYLKQIITDGELGDPLYIYSHRLNLGVVRQKENAWWSLAPHDISVACYLFDAEPVSVSATGQVYLQSGVEDVVFGSIKFANGQMAHVHVSWLDPHKIRKTTLVGTKKMAVFDDMEPAEKVRIFDKSVEVQQGVVSYVDAISLRAGDILSPRILGGEPLRTECQHFIDAIQKDFTPRSDGRDGLRVVQALQAGAESLKRGGEPVSV